jgi:hypothetical protein
MIMDGGPAFTTVNTGYNALLLECRQFNRSGRPHARYYEG